MPAHAALLLHRRNLLRVAQRLGQKTARAGCVAEFPIGQGQLDRTLRSVADAHEEGCRMVGIGFGPSRQQQLIGCSGTFRFDRSFAVATRGQDLRVGRAIFRIVRDLEQRRDERHRDVQLSARERHLGAMSSSRNMRGQDRVEFGEDRLRTIQIAAAHRAHAPFEQQLAARERRHAIVGIERGCIAGFCRYPLTHFRQQRRERAKRVNPRIVLRQSFAQNQRVLVSSRRLQQRRPFEVDLVPWMAGRERLIEKRVRFLEAMETPREPRTDVERACGTGRQRDRLGGDLFRPVMIRDTAEHVTAKKQNLRQRDQVFEGRTFGTAKLQALDRCRKIGDGDSAARIASGVDHDAFFNPVSSAG